MMHVCNLSARETELGGLWVQGQPGLSREICVKKYRKQKFKTYPNAWIKESHQFAFEMFTFLLIIPTGRACVWFTSTLIIMLFPKFFLRLEPMFINDILGSF
jgi:hypothetical protein